MAASNPVVSFSTRQASCRDCQLRAGCLPAGLTSQALEELDRIKGPSRLVRRGEHLVRAGDEFRSLYVVRSGCVKSYAMSEDGEEHISGFHLGGELVGLEAIATGHYESSVKALDTALVCVIPFEGLEQLSGRSPELHRQLLRLMSGRIAREHQDFEMLGRMSAESRLARFILDLSRRFDDLGFSPREFQLKMSNHDIANRLSLANETVSRLFARFRSQGVLGVDHKQVHIHDTARLREVAGEGPTDFDRQHPQVR